MKPILIDWSIFKIYSYPLFMGIAWGISFHLYNYLIELYQKKSKEDLSGSGTLFWGVFLSSWVGAKVFFLFSSAQGEYELYLSSTNFWLGGGFVFYGGLIFGLLFIGIYSVMLKKFPKEYLFLAIPPLCFSHAVGRIGCLLAGCCFGIKSNLLWSINLHGSERHPVQIYESIALFFIGFILLRRILKRVDTVEFNLKAISRSTIFFYFILYSTTRYFIEFLRGDLVRGINSSGYSTSQIVSIIIFILSIIFAYNNKKEFNKVS